MKKLFFVSLVLGAVLASCSPKDVKVTVENTTALDRQSEMVEIPVEDFKAKVTLQDGETYIVRDAKGEVVPSQLTYDGKLIFQSGLHENEKAVFTITAGAPQTFDAKTYGRFIQERKDDFAWENDKVAFRVYGPALVASDGPSNGIDIWYKRTNNLIVDKWYKDDLAKIASYHEDHGEGQDDYKVGRSLGAGAMAPYAGDKLWLNSNFASQELLENGPLRTTFKLTYNNFDVDGKSIGETRTFSIDAGLQLTKVIQEFTGVEGSMPVAAGIVKREGKDSIITSVENNYLIYAEPASEVVENVYVALAFPSGFEKSVVDTYKVSAEQTDARGRKKTVEVPYSHVLGVTAYQANTPLVYYTGYGWSKFGFATVADFQKYMDEFTKALKEPLVVTVQ